MGSTTATGFCLGFFDSLLPRFCSFPAMKGSFAWNTPRGLAGAMVSATRRRARMGHSSTRRHPRWRAQTGAWRKGKVCRTQASSGGT